jgi:tetratricopeptide (TPR) repeat protein
MISRTKPYKDHAFSRYLCVSPAVVHELQVAYFAGHDLNSVFRHIDGKMAAIIVAETLEADRIWHLAIKDLFQDTYFQSEKQSDFIDAILVEMFFMLSKMVREAGDELNVSALLLMALFTLQKVAQSPVASPLLWYEDIFIELARLSLENQDAIHWTKRALAHNLRYGEGNNALAYLHDLAEAYLVADELDTALSMFTTLLHHDPGDIWIYNTMALAFEAQSLTSLGIQAAQRGLELIAARDGKVGLEDQLMDSLARLETSESQGREAEVDPQILADIRSALTLDFDAGEKRHLEILCRELVPDLNTLPVKRPMRPSDFPLPDRPPMPHRRMWAESPIGRKLTHALSWLRLHAQAAKPLVKKLFNVLTWQPSRAPATKPGRNDPCWCGSGKKYKHCHLQKDRRL